MMTENALKFMQDAWLANLQNELAAANELRWDLHRDPRISGEEADTRDRFLLSTPFGAVPVADTGAIGKIGPAKGPAIGLRAELDALPVAELTGAESASTNGAMHACGHDVHLAALSAVVRSANGLDLPFGLVPILQPREEAYPSGARDIITAGDLDRLNVTHVIGAHVHPNVAYGSVATGEGFVNAAAGEIEIIVEGQGGHGAYPHHASDVVSTLASTALAIPEVLRRTIDPIIPALVSVGTLEAGSGASNVLANHGRILATVRTTLPGDAERIVGAIERLAQGQANAYGTSATVSYTKGEPTLSNDRALSIAMDDILPEVGLNATEPMRSLGADDFSYFSSTRPSVMCFVGVDSVSKQGHGQASLHDPTFLPDDDAVARIAKTLIAGYLAAVSILSRDKDAELSLPSAVRSAPSR